MTSLSSCVMTTHMPDQTLLHRGKVRDVYDMGDSLLIVATDRISAFDCVLPTGLPGKGQLLTEISLFWFHFLKDMCPHHLISAKVEDYPAALKKYRDQLEGRSMWVKKAKMIEIECIVRGYLTGSGWKEYQQQGMVCGIPLPKGLKKSEKLEKPLFTPSTKAKSGHDVNIAEEQAVAIAGAGTVSYLKDMSLKIYQKAADYARERGIILCDTKFEFGIWKDQIILIDEVLTPDSSRFWDAATYAAGQENDSFDKQIVRDYLEGLTWNKQPPAPTLPEAVVNKTLQRYREIVQRLQKK